MRKPPERKRAPKHHTLRIEDAVMVVGSDAVEHTLLNADDVVVCLPESECPFDHSEDHAQDSSMDGTIQTISRIRAIKGGRQWVNLVGYPKEDIYCGGCFRPVHRKELS